MGESAAETVREIEHVREELDGKVRELESRLPAPAVLAKRAAGVALGSGVGGSVFWFVVRRVRRRRRSQGRPTSGPSTVEIAIPEIPDGWRPLAMWVAAAWVLLRLAQLREARRTNRLLIARTR